MKATAKIFSFFIGMLCPCLISAQGAGNADKQIQEKTETLLDRIKQHVNIGGYAHIGYVYNDFDPASGKSTNSFEITRVMLTADIKITDRLNAFCMYDLAKGTLHEIWAEYAFAPAFKLKAGQFKTPYTIESNMALSVVEQIRGAQAVQYMAGINGSDPSYGPFAGRDIGIMASGSLLNVGSHDLFAYSIGVFNGQGINTKDVDNRKDIIGGVWLMPVAGLRIGAFGWTGSYARKGEDGVKSLGKYRYAISGEYAADDWTFRSEYIHSTGYGFSKVYNQSSDAKDAAVDYSSGNRADGFYALAIAPVIKKKLHVKARYDMYRPQAEWGTSKTFYELGIDYLFVKNLQVNLEYAFVNDRSLARHNYSMIDTQLSFRF